MTQVPDFTFVKKILTATKVGGDDASSEIKLSDSKPVCPSKCPRSTIFHVSLQNIFHLQSGKRKSPTLMFESWKNNFWAITIDFREVVDYFAETVAGFRLITHFCKLELERAQNFRVASCSGFPSPSPSLGRVAGVAFLEPSISYCLLSFVEVA